MKSKIEFYRSESQQMNDAVDRMVVEIYRRKREAGSKSILLTGCSSEAGTTTNAINLAIALSIAGWKTLLVDCDLRKGSKYKRLNDNVHSGLTEYLSQKVSIADITYDTSYEGLFYIPCGEISDSPVRLFCSQRMENLAESLTREYDYVIYDFPSICIVPDAEILAPFVDSIALVAGLNLTTKRQLGEAKDKVAEYQDKYMGLIINQVELGEYRKYNKDFDYFRQKSFAKKYKKNKQVTKQSQENTKKSGRERKR